MRSIKNILNRIKAVEGIDSDYKLAQIFDLTPSYISTWRKRGTIPYKELHKYCQTKGVSFDWLLTGEGEMFLKHSKASSLDEEAAQLRVEITAEAAKVDPKNYNVAKRILKELQSE